MGACIQSYSAVHLLRFVPLRLDILYKVGGIINIIKWSSKKILILGRGI